MSLLTLAPGETSLNRVVVAVRQMIEFLNSGAPWASYTPVVTSSAGTITALGTVTGRWTSIGKTVFVQIDIAITTNGTASSHLRATLPTTVANFDALNGLEINVTGKVLSAVVQSSQTYASILYYDATYPGADGTRFIISGSYEKP